MKTKQTNLQVPNIQKTYNIIYEIKTDKYSNIIHNL